MKAQTALIALFDAANEWWLSLAVLHQEGQHWADSLVVLQLKDLSNHLKGSVS